MGHSAHDSWWMNKKVDGHDKYAYSSKTTKVLISIAHCVVKQPNMKPHSSPLQSSASSSSCCSKLPSVILLWVVVTGKKTGYKGTG